MAGLRAVLMTSKLDENSNSDTLAPPMGLYRLRAALLHAGHECDVVDWQLNDGRACRDVEEGRYDVIGMSVSHMQMELDLDLLWRFRRALRDRGRRFLFLAGGHSATQGPLTWLECGFDAIGLGYCEDTIVEIFRAFEARPEADPPEMFRDVQGVAFLDASGELRIKPSPLLSQDWFQRIAYHEELKTDLPYRQYWDEVRRRATNLQYLNGRSFVVENARIFSTSRCIAKCGFCPAPRMLAAAQGGAPGRLYSTTVDQFLDVVRHDVRRYGARAFSINDEDFLIGNREGVERGMAICRRIMADKESGALPAELRFSCQTRPTNFLGKIVGRHETINLELIELMQRSGFHNVSMGIETFCDRLRREPSMNKTGIHSEQIHAILDAMTERGLFFTINQILLIPESTPEDLLDSIRQVMRYLDRPCQIQIAPLMMAFTDAPLLHRGYETTFTTWKHPETGREIRIPEDYVPHHPVLRDLAQVIRPNGIEELEAMKRRFGLSSDALIPRIAYGLCMLLAAARFLHEEELSRRLERKIGDLTAASGLRTAS